MRWISYGDALGSRWTWGRLTRIKSVPNRLLGDTATRVVTFDAQPEPIAIDTARTAVIVVDMQNDFGAKGGMLDRAGIDLSSFQRIIGPTVKVLVSARRAGVKVIYLKYQDSNSPSLAGPTSEPSKAVSSPAITPGTPP